MIVPAIRPTSLSPLTPLPCLWPGATIVCIGSGPSLRLADVDRCQSYPTIVVNDAWRMAPWAQVIYAADARWWQWNADIASGVLPPLKVTIDPVAREHRSDLLVLQRTGQYGLEYRPWGLRSGGCSGYQAMNAAVHLGARRIILLGYDMMPGVDGANHFFGEHATGQHPLYAVRVRDFDTMKAPLVVLNIDVINASRRTAITAFPCAPIEEVLAQWPPLFP